MPPKGVQAYLQAGATQAMLTTIAVVLANAYNALLGLAHSPIADAFVLTDAVKSSIAGLAVGCLLLRVGATPAPAPTSEPKP